MIGGKIGMNFIDNYIDMKVRASEKKSIGLIKLIVCVLLFVAIAIIQASTVTASNISGVLAQFQVMLSVYLVLNVMTKGYMVAIIMNVVHVIMVSRVVFFHHVVQAIPGIVVPLSTIIIITIINLFVSRLNRNFATVTEQTERLRESEEKFRLLFENMNNGFSLNEVVVDEQGKPVDFRFVMLNKGYEDQMNLHSEDILGKTMLEINPKADREMILKYCKVGLTQNPVHLEYYSKTFDRWFRVTAYSPQKCFFATIFEDITEVKKVKDALILSQMRLNLATTNARIGLWDHMVKTGEIYYNEQCSNIIGYTLPELNPVNIDEYVKLIHPEDIQRVTKILKRVYSKEIEFYECEIRIKHRDGKWVWVLYGGKIVEWDEKGSPVRIVGTLMDITKQKKNETELVNSKEKAEKENSLKTEFFANMSHELRTPLNVVLSTIQLFELYARKKEDLPREKTENYIKSMKQSSLRLLRLVNNLIDVSKIDSGFYEPVFNNYNIIDVIEKIILSIKDYAEQKNIKVKFKSDLKEKIVKCDVDMIERIMLNLISNSIKFSSENCFIHISIANKPESVVINVKDNGVGIEKDKQNMIFEKYKQVSTTLSRNCEGSGIGLSLTKSLVEMHGGEINVKSEYGKGSEFIIEIPNVKCTEEEIMSNSFYDLEDNYRLISKMNVEFSDIYT